MGTMTLSDVVLYIVVGYVFIQVFNFIVSNQDPSEFQHLFFKAIISGFILVNAMLLFPISFKNEYWEIAFVLLASIVLSYIAAQIYTSVMLKKVLKTINIRRTVNPYIWNDIEDKNKTLWVHVGFKQLNVQYLGKLVCIEDFHRQPIIVLGNYSQCQFDDNINDVNDTAIDCTSDSKQRIVIDTARADYIKLIYDKDSENIKNDDTKV